MKNLKLKEDNIIQGVGIAIEALSLSHFMFFFADNNFMFSNALFNEIRANTLEDYCDRYGQLIDLNKSSIAFSKGVYEKK